MNDQREQPDRSIGEILSAARLEQSLSVREVSRQLKLPSTIVEHIENNRLEALAPIYRRGYILNYARELGVPVETIKALLDGVDNEPPALQEVLPTGHDAWKLERYLRVATYVLTTTVVVIPLVWIIVQVSADFFETEEMLVRSSLSEERERPETGRVSQRIAQAIAIEDRDRGTTEGGHLSASAAPLSAFKPRGASEGGITLLIGDPELPGPPLMEDLVAAEPAGIPLTAGARTIVLEVQEDCWVEITDAQGRRLEFDLLRQGRHEFHGAAPFRFLLGKASAVRLQVDGEWVDFTPHSSADIARFEVMDDGRLRG